jgi:hypothetical protein
MNKNIPMNITIIKNGKQLGPYSTDEVNRKLTEGTLSELDMAWHEGLTNWSPLNSIAGVVAGRLSITPPLPPVVIQANANKRLIVIGYICAFVSLFCFPPGFGIAGLVLGILALTKGSTGHGITIIVLSVTLGVVGACIGASLAS